MRSWEFVAPGAIGEAVEVCAPSITQAPFTTGTTLLAVGAVDGHSGKDAGLTAVLTLVAYDGGIVYLSGAFFAGP